MNSHIAQLLFISFLSIVRKQTTPAFNSFGPFVAHNSEAGRAQLGGSSAPHSSSRGSELDRV